MATATPIDAREVASQPGKLRWLAITVIWMAAAGFGLSWMWEYEATPGAVTEAPTTWPADSRIQLAPDRPTLILFAHPRCPCTRASINELSRLMTRCHGRLDAQVWFFQPTSASNEWARTDLWRGAHKIPGVIVKGDADGSEAAKFHALTSGHSLLYDPTGQLLFSGGITASRGHCGDNLGKQSIESIVLGGESDAQRTLVFGCPLRGRDEINDTEI